MILHREIRILYVKLASPINTSSLKIIKTLWDLPKGISVCLIDTLGSEIFIHTDSDFTPQNLGASIKYMRLILQLLNKKIGYIIIRKVLASKSSLWTELECYRITKRRVHLSALPDSPELIRDALMLSGRNKRIQSADFFENILRKLDNQNKNCL